MFPGRWVLSFECASLNLRRKRSATLRVEDAVSWAINSDRHAIFKAGMKPMHEPDNAVCSSHSHCFAELLSNCALLSWPQQNLKLRISQFHYSSHEITLVLKGAKIRSIADFSKPIVLKALNLTQRQLLPYSLCQLLSLNWSPVLVPTLWSFKETREGVSSSLPPACIGKRRSWRAGR